MKQVTVIGAGAMGRQIALQCALRGFPVVLNGCRQNDKIMNCTGHHGPD